MKNSFIKQLSFSLIILGLITLALVLQSCQPDENIPKAKSATVSTHGVTLITGSSAVSGGQISSDGGFDISTKGICWDTIPNPTIGDSFILDTSEDSEFTAELRGLAGGKSYYVRAYATNAGGISYGNEEMFTTNTVPLISTNEVTEITGNSVKSGGSIIETFGTVIIDRGICWSEQINPSITDEKVSLAAGENTFEATMVNLQSGTLYHVRSYVITVGGDVAYGENVLFQTQLLDYDGNVYTTVLIGEQVWMVQNFKSTHYNDGTPIDVSNYAWHPDDTNSEYGLNYSWTSIDDSNFAPKGWHVPSNDEWTELFDYVQNNGNKLKVTGTDYWNTANGTNESGFSALGSAHIYGVPLKAETTWWSATIGDNGNPYRWGFDDNGDISGGPWNGAGFKFSVRLIKD